MVTLGMSLLTLLNLPLVIITLAVVGYLVLLLNSNNEMRRMADDLNARADAKEFREKRYQEYRKQRQ